VPSSHSTLLPRDKGILETVTFIGQMFYLSQSEIKFHNIATKSKFGVRTGETICFAENVDSLPIFT
jgi:hypothetical protein